MSGILIHEDAIAYGDDGIYTTDPACEPPCCSPAGEEYLRAIPCPGDAPCANRPSDLPEEIYVRHDVLCDGQPIPTKVVDFAGWCYRVRADSGPRDTPPPGAILVDQDQTGCEDSCAESPCRNAKFVRVQTCGRPSSATPTEIWLCERSLPDSCYAVYVEGLQDIDPSFTEDAFCFNVDINAARTTDTNQPPLAGVIDLRGEPMLGGATFNGCCECEAASYGSVREPECDNTTRDPTDNRSRRCGGIVCCERFPSGMIYTSSVSASYSIDEIDNGLRTGSCDGGGEFYVDYVYTASGAGGGSVERQRSGNPDAFLGTPPTFSVTEEKVYTGTCGDSIGVPPDESDAYDLGMAVKMPTTETLGVKPYLNVPGSVAGFCEPYNGDCTGPTSRAKSGQYTSGTPSLPPCQRTHSGSSYYTWSCTGGEAGYSYVIEDQCTQQTDNAGRVTLRGGLKKRTSVTSQIAWSVSYVANVCDCSNPDDVASIEEML